MLLDEMEQKRYARQIMLPEVGEQGQLKLKKSSVLCIGAGGLGSVLLQYLAASGVGRIGIIDHDVVEISNLQRQILYTHADIGMQKVNAAHHFLSQLNPQINIDIYPSKFNTANAKALIERYDVIADCTDNLINRYLVNSICHALNKPFVYAGISRYQGQCMMFYGTPHPCFECVFPYDVNTQELPDCNNAGVLSVLPGMLGLMQTNLILQYILQIEEPVKNCFYALDIRNMKVRQYHVVKDHACPICVYGKRRNQNEVRSITADELSNLIHNGKRFTLLDVRTNDEYEQYHLNALLIPLHELQARLHELHPEENIIIYCQSGRRSYRAAELLMDNGFQNVCYLEHGISDFKL